jgi:hypothetical protein
MGEEEVEEDVKGMRMGQQVQHVVMGLTSQHSVKPSTACGSRLESKAGQVHSVIGTRASVTDFD